MPQAERSRGLLPAGAGSPISIKANKNDGRWSDVIRSHWLRGILTAGVRLGGVSGGLMALTRRARRSHDHDHDPR